MAKHTAECILRETIARLKILRKRSGFSHEQLALKAGVSRVAISHIENGKRKPSLLLILKLSHALGVELSELVRLAEKPPKCLLVYL